MIWGDPHIVTFDLMAAVRRDFHRERSRNRGGATHWRLGSHLVPDVFKEGTFWAVQSQQILIQGRYTKQKHYQLRGLAFGGPFMQNHRLAIDDMVDGLGRVSWDGQTVSAAPRFRNDLVTVVARYDGRNIFQEATITLPAGVRVRITRSRFVQGVITMRQQHGGQDGHCGQADGTFPEDQKGYLMDRWGAGVPRSEQLFATPFTLLESLLEADPEPSMAEHCAEDQASLEANQSCDAALNGTATALADVLRPGCLVDVCALGPEAAQSVAHAAGEATAALQEGWYDGGEGGSCEESCLAVGLVCTEEQLFAHNSDVDSTEKILALVDELGGETPVQECDQVWGTADDVPNWSLTVCHGSSPSRALSTFSCSARPRGGSHPKRRLCWCHSP